MKRLSGYFLQGLLFLGPIAVTIYAFVTVFRMIDAVLPFESPGLGFVVLIAGITLVGFLVSTFFAGRLNRWVDRSFQRLPLAKLIYGAVKDLLSAFVGEQRRFDTPVLVTLAAGEHPVQALGFLTAPSLSKLHLDGLVAVYLPQSYNFAGFTVVVPRDKVRVLKADSAEVMAFIVSGGVASTAAAASRASMPAS